METMGLFPGEILFCTGKYAKLKTNQITRTGETCKALKAVQGRRERAPILRGDRYADTAASV